MNITRAVWAEIDLDNLAHNIQEIRKCVSKQSKIAAVVKADAYGHGASEIAQTLLENGADMFAVATLSEAIRLREEFEAIPILILGYTPAVLIDEIVKNNLMITVYSLEQAKQVNYYALQHNIKIAVHLKIDSGMHRLGFMVNQSGIEDVLACYQLQGLIIEGVYTHFACADSDDQTVTKAQFAKFQKMLKAIAEAGFDIKYKHCANSAATLTSSEYHLDMVRVGLLLYGLYPSPSFVNKINLKQVMSMRAMISQVRVLDKDEGISYGHVYHTTEEEIIAALPIGYADGFSRSLTGKGSVIYKGQRYPLVGRVCMDQVMVRLDDREAKRGDIVTIFGEDNGEFRSIDELANELDTINYEIVCMLDKRIPRHYIKGGKVIKIIDDILKLVHGREDGI